MSDTPESLDDIAASRQPETPESEPVPRRGPGRPKGSTTKNKPGAKPGLSVPNQPPPPDPEIVKAHAMMTVAVLIQIPIQMMKLDPYSPSEEKVMMDSTYPVLEKYAGELIAWAGPEFALFGACVMILAPKVQKRRAEIAMEKSKVPVRDNIFAQT